MLSKTILTAFVAILWQANVEAQPQSQPAARPSPKRTSNYGSNPTAGRTFTHDGIKLYYEVYGTGEPLLVIHGNGSSIGELKPQIDHFRKRYQVIAMDSRDHGKSGGNTDRITYEKMTDDLAALLDHLKSPPVNVLGWSDGGIEALLLGIRHPAKVKKIAAMAANLNPEGIHPEGVVLIKSMMDSMPAAAQETPQGKRELKVTQLMLDEPHVRPEALEAITAPTLVLASDHDLVRDEHTLEIYHYITNRALHFSERDAHGSLRRSRSVQLDCRAILPHAFYEKGSHQGPPQVVRGNEGLPKVGEVCCGRKTGRRCKLG